MFQKSSTDFVARYLLQIPVTSTLVLLCEKHAINADIVGGVIQIDVEVFQRNRPLQCQKHLSSKLPGFHNERITITPFLRQGLAFEERRKYERETFQ